MTKRTLSVCLLTVAALAITACDKKDDAAPSAAPGASASSAPASAASASAAPAAPAHPGEDHARHWEGDGGRPEGKGDNHGHDRPH